MPFPRYNFKRVISDCNLGHLLGLANFGGVDVIRNLLTGCVPLFPSLGKGNLRISPEGHQFFLTREEVLESPQLGPGGSD